MREMSKDQGKVEKGLEKLEESIKEVGDLRDALHRLEAAVTKTK